MEKIWNRITDNSLFSWFILPIALYNIIESYLSMRKQFNELKNAINENENFATALATLSFKPGKFFNLVADFETDLEMTDDEVYKIANQQIVVIVKNYVVDERLLGIVKIEFMRKENRIIEIHLQSADKNVFMLDIRNLTYSVLFTSALISAYFMIF